MSFPAIFFDRDNTLIVNDGYLGDPNGVVLVADAAAAIVRARSLGFKIIVISNQSGVARGLYTEDDVRAVDARMNELLRKADPRAIVDRNEFCPFHPEGTVEKYRMESELRKPKPGMILKAAGEMNLDLSKSWVIGDQIRDIEAGSATGSRTILIRGARSSAIEEAKAGAVVSNLAQAIQWIADAK